MMNDSDIDDLNYYNISGEKECDKFGHKIFVQVDSNHVQDVESGNIISLSENNEEHDENKIMEFSYYLFMCRMIECICMKVYDFFYYIKNREL